LEDISTAIILPIKRV